MEHIIDGLEIKSKDDFHQRIKALLDLPEYYGENLDALWDCLTSDVELPLTVVWRNYAQSKLYLGDYADKALEVMKEAEKELDGFKIECD